MIQSLVDMFMADGVPDQVMILILYTKLMFIIIINVYFSKKVNTKNKNSNLGKRIKNIQRRE
jgi:hypothetical protein